MDVKIGVVYTPKELVLELDESPDDIVKAVESALKDGAAMVWFTDKKGRRVGVPADKIAYVELGEEESRRVGFGPV